MTRTAWIVGGVLLVGLVALGIAIRIANSRPRFHPDEGLLDELAEVELIEDAPPPATSWPGWRGPARDGSVSFAALSRKWDGRGPRVLHKLPGGDGYSSFAIRDGLAWTVVARDDEEVVVCYDLKAGSEKWRRAHTPARAYQYGGPRATPAVDGDDLFALHCDGVLKSLRASDGTENWKATLELTPPQWGFTASPLVDGQTVHLGPAAFDRTTGEKRWEKGGLVVGYSSPVLTTLGGVRQVVYFAGDQLVGLDPGGGGKLWSFTWHTPFKVNAATPLVIRARKGDEQFLYVFITSGYEKGCALVRVAREGDAFTTRAVYESNELCCHFASPVRRGNYIYGLDEQRDLTCLDLRKGKAVWRQRGFLKGSVILVDDTLLLLGENGNLALAEASPEGYMALAMARPLRDRCWAMPALAGGLLLIRDRKSVIVLEVGK